MKSLGILVTSDTCPQYIDPMVRAAHGRGLSVHLHLTGTGVCLVTSMDLEALAELAHITICRSSAATHQVTDRLDTGCLQMLAEPGEMVCLIETCDRHVVL